MKMCEKRKQDVSDLYRQGATFQAIGEHIGVTRQRAYQICSRIGLLSTPGSRSRSKYPFNELTHDGAATLIRTHSKPGSVRVACRAHSERNPYRVKVAKLSDAANEDGYLYQLYREDRE